MARNSRPQFMEIMEKFIKRPRAGVPPGSYHPMGAVVLCKLTYLDRRYSNMRIQECLVFRSSGPENHAEAKLLRYLRHHEAANSSRVINIEVFQNLSPCNDSVGIPSCVQSLIEYKLDLERRRKVIHIEITFANFYRSSICFDNSHLRAIQNSTGLQLLQSRGIKLKLLAGKDEWERLLRDDQLVNLNHHEKAFCLAKTMAPEGVARELDDKWMFHRILGVAANRLTYDEVMNYFIVPNHDSVVLVCKISYLQNGYWCRPECLVLRGGAECAEAKLLLYLRAHDGQASVIKVHVIQNLFPCSVRPFQQRFSCVTNILLYMQDLERQVKTIFMSFKLRSYSLADHVSHDCNVQALLNSGNIKIRPLRGRQNWEAFLRDKHVVDLNGQQVQDMLLALSLPG